MAVAFQVLQGCKGLPLPLLTILLFFNYVKNTRIKISEKRTSYLICIFVLDRKIINNNN